MKKNGFTLAEVLITLAIIGVVATLTLPSLMSNTAEQQAVTAYRKALNTLNEAAQMNAALDGFDYGQLSSGSDEPATDNMVDDSTELPVQSVWGILSNRAQVDVSTSTGSDKITGACDGLSQIFFRDGTVLCYTPVDTSGADDVTEGYIDTNGFKGPNAVSECTDELCKKAGRNIKDQFPVTLHGSNALPGKVTFANGLPTESSDSEDMAARWAMKK